MAAQVLNTCWALAVLGRFRFSSRAPARARFRSFWCRLMRKPGSKVPLTMRSPCTSRIREEAKPPISASRTLAGSAPLRAANSRASATAWMFSATMIWLATLAVWPSPLPPTRVMFLPIAWNSGRARSKVFGQPPTMMLRVAALAPTSPPETGASRYCAPVALIFSAKPLVAVGEIELMSITTLFGPTPSAIPSLRNSTSSTCGVSGTMTMMNSASWATSFGLARAMAPASSRSAGAASWWVERNRLWPAFCRFCAMGLPMIPVPMNPILAMRVSPGSVCRVAPRREAGASCSWVRIRRRCASSSSRGRLRWWWPACTRSRSSPGSRCGPGARRGSGS
ncbi:hypothetical protein ALP65_04559 [Pseudomonas aeruginosa]|uniref:Uncharacterized protein n=1 Tax=Pseudomonas aeruginosa TaxID=287 RepID=A0A3M5EXN7_PSEAI|nr:hypothetical protein ALP65_04559 [Pseudomonas aeruginosa]